MSKLAQLSPSAMVVRVEKDMTFTVSDLSLTDKPFAESQTTLQGLAKALGSAILNPDEASLKVLEDDKVQVVNGAVQQFIKSHLKSLEPGTTFVVFPNLPAEMRNKIWNAVTDGFPRTIIFEECVYPNGMVGTRFHGATIPAAFTACKEALQEVQWRSKYEPMLKIFGRKAPFFNPVIDALEFYTPYPIPFHGLNSDMVEPKDLRAVKTLQFDGDLVVCKEGWFLHHVLCMTNLELVKIKKNICVSRRVPELALAIEFGEVGNNPHGCFELDELESMVVPRVEVAEGEFAYGMNAIRAIQEYVLDPSDRQDIMDIWMALTRIYKETENLPANIQLVFRYHH